jgi:hypothetical protein
MQILPVLYKASTSPLIAENVAQLLYNLRPSVFTLEESLGQMIAGVTAQGIKPVYPLCQPQHSASDLLSSELFMLLAMRCWSMDLKLSVNILDSEEVMMTRRRNCSTPCICPGPS